MAKSDEAPIVAFTRIREGDYEWSVTLRAGVDDKDIEDMFGHMAHLTTVAERVGAVPMWDGKYMLADAATAAPVITHHTFVTTDGPPPLPADADIPKPQPRPTVDVVRVKVDKTKDGKQTLRFYEMGHKYPLKGMYWNFGGARFLQLAGADTLVKAGWEEAHFEQQDAVYDVNLRISYDEEGGFKNIKGVVLL